jgi:glucosylceramidase
MEFVHAQHSDRNVYFTEQWIGARGNLAQDLAWHIRNVIIGSTRNWCRVALEWNLVSNANYTPHTDGGCTSCLGALTIDDTDQPVVRNPGYYVVAHASKFVRPGSHRISSVSANDALPNVAFETTISQSNTKTKTTVLIVLNDDDNCNEQLFSVRFNQQWSFNYTLTSKAVATFVVQW